ncbi:MAG: LamG domain-containing protein [Planctomycetota bacterium]|jgi:hypothetical protein
MHRKSVLLILLVVALGVTDMTYGYARWRNTLGNQDFSNQGNWVDPASLISGTGRMVLNRGPAYPNYPTDPPIMSYTPDPCYAPIDLRGPGYDADISHFEWYVMGGSMHVTGPWQMCYNSGTTGYTEMTGGKLIFDEDILCPRTDGTTATVLLHGGTVRAAGIQFKPGGLIDLAGEGRLVLDGNEDANVPTWEGAGNLTADGGLGELFVEYDAGLDITIITASNVRAWKPQPATMARNICLSINLSWTPGADAAETGGHDVYFGTSFSDVDNAGTSSVGIYQGRQDSNSHPEIGTLSLELDKTYYWRVDEVNGINVWKGAVWQFTTNDGTAHGPDPVSGAVTVARDVVVQWEPGCLAASHDVFFGTDFNDVNDATSGYYPNVEYSNVGVSSFDPNGELAYFTTYYWRVDEVGAASQRWRGDVWSFRTESAIVDPNLRLWYKFDELEGDWVYDSSGREFNSNDGTVGDNLDPNGGHFGGALWCDDDIGLAVSPEMLGGISDGITISVWLKDAYRDGDDNTVFGAGSDGDDPYQLRADVVEQGTQQVMWRAGNDTNDVIRWNLGGQNPSTLDGWHHWGFVKDDVTGEISIYFDGRSVETADTGDATLGEVAGKAFKVGSSGHSNTDLVGWIDDLRVYDYAMSFSEVAGLFRGEEAERAWLPEPVDNAQDVAREVTLSWLPGDFAVYHDVYFSTSFDDVNDAGTANTSIYKGRQALGELTYEPPSLLELDTTYYWRIDEVNEPNIWKGSVWRFTVADYLVVDDMESYNAISGSGNEIFDTWDDGFMNWTGSQVALEYSASTTIHGGDQSMKLQYDNAIGYYKYSEVDANTAGPVPGNLTIGNDWTAYDLKAMTVFFYGQAGNDANEQMYVAIEDGSSNIAIVKYGDMGEDMNDVGIAQWHQWEIPLSAFADNGVTLTNVAKVRIGFGDRTAPVVGGSGIVFFDDIRLYLPKCVPWIVKPAADISNNCIVDFVDIELLAQDWLEFGYGTVNPTAPDGGKLALQYLFDDTSGSTVEDNTANNYDGLFIVDVNQTPGDISLRMDANSKSGTSIHFSAGLGYSGVAIPNDVFVDYGLSEEITLSMWIMNVHPDEQPDSGAFMWEFREWDGSSPDAGDRVLAVEVSGGGDDYGFHDDDDSVWYEHEWDDHSEWQHYAFIRDAYSLKIYVDGVLESVDNSSGNPMAVPGLLYLGISADRAPTNTQGFHDGFTGNIDDFRIYSYALSYGEVVGLAEKPSVYDAVDSVANLHEANEEETVNFKDFGVIADSWLEEILWPQ